MRETFAESGDESRGAPPSLASSCATKLRTVTSKSSSLSRPSLVGWGLSPLREICNVFLTSMFWSASSLGQLCDVPKHSVISDQTQFFMSNMQVLNGCFTLPDPLPDPLGSALHKVNLGMITCSMTAPFRYMRDNSMAGPDQIPYTPSGT